MMDSPPSPIVLTKLRAPALRPRRIPREHLLERLAGETGASLVLVCAPAGYGKTTLLAEWSQVLTRSGAAVAWLALDPGDNAPIPFGACLVAALAQATGESQGLGAISQQLRSSLEIDLRNILPAVINAMAAVSRKCVLVLDDYHLITDPAIHQAMTYLLGHLPGNLCMAIGSRANPPLPLARLRAQGKLIEIRTAALRFKYGETARFLSEVMRLDLAPESIAALEARTEGWVAGLQLAGLSLSGQPDPGRLIASFTGSHRYLVDYLLEEVVNRQPEEVQEFLLLTSVLDRLCAPLCDALLGASGPRADAVLRYLEQANIFVVALDEEGMWYRYHPLFRDFLRTWLQKTQPERVPDLHRSASAWLAANGSLREAAAHAFQTRDWDAAAAFVEQHAFTLIVHSEIATIHEWCSAFPEDVLSRHPMLYVHQCWPLVLRFRQEYRPKIAQRLRQVEQAAAGMEDRQQAGELLEAAAAVRGLLAMTPDPWADPREQLASAETAAAAYPEGHGGRFSPLLVAANAHLALYEAQPAAGALITAREIALREGLYFGVVESTVQLACLAISQGRLDRAAQLCQETRADLTALLAHPEEELRAIGCLDVILGLISLEQDRLQEAERLLAQGLDRMGWGMNPYYLMLALAALFRLCQIQGRSAEALAHLARLEEAWPDIAFYTGGLRIAHSLRAAPGDPRLLAAAERWTEEVSSFLGGADFLPGLGPFGAAEVYYRASLVWAQIQIACGRPQAARAFLERLFDPSIDHDLAGRVIELSLLEAQAWNAEGNGLRAIAALERALSAAQPEGYLRVFDQGSALSAMLAEAAAQGICADYAHRILAAISRPETASPVQGAAREPQETPPGVSVDPLSERELDVLRLIARGASNQAIAEQLVITVGTVKSHINHILDKLDARNRTEAVARAREMGWRE